MKTAVLNTVVVIVLAFSVKVFAEETVGCPHDVGKGKIKIRGRVMYIRASECYSDEVYKAFRADSPYSMDYDRMVALPDGWHQTVLKIAVGLEYGIIDRLSMGILVPYAVKDVRRQMWSMKQNKTVWKVIDDSGFGDFWISAKFLVYSESPGLFGFDWTDGFFVAVSYKPPLGSDQQVKNGLASGTHDFKLVFLSHPYLRKNLFICTDVWYQYRGKVKMIEDFSRAGWNLGDRFGYRVFVGYEFFEHKFAVVAGPQGWIGLSHEDKSGKEVEDSSTYTHGIVLKLRWQPLQDEEAGSIDLAIRIPVADKIPFSPSLVPFAGARIKF